MPGPADAPTPHVAHVGTPFARNPFLRRLTLAYAVAWTLAGIAPWDRQTWLLENLLVVALVGALVATHRRFVFSNFSYGLIAAFLALHVVGSHYTYSAVPFTARLAEAFDLSRNHYDRFVHFAFGLLLAYPLREMALRVVHAHRGWSYGLPPIAILALSSAYEIIESWAARLVNPEIGIAFVGAQGDVWDGPKDMTLALVGAGLAMLATAGWRRRTGHEPWLGWRPARPAP